MYPLWRCGMRGRSREGGLGANHFDLPYTDWLHSHVCVYNHASTYMWVCVSSAGDFNARLRRKSKAENQSQAKQSEGSKSGPSKATWRCSFTYRPTTSTHTHTSTHSLTHTQFCSDSFEIRESEIFPQRKNGTLRFLLFETLWKRN